jgi:hypothetical protein
MNHSAEEVPMLRLPTWTWAMLFVLIAPLNYFAFREGYRGTDVMWSENIFLVFLSALIAWNFCFVFKNRELIFSRLPAWLRPYGVRFVVYFAAAMALSGVVSVLRLPAFYESVLSRGVIFFLLPYMLGPRRFAWRFLEKASSADLVPANSDAEMIFQYNRWRASFLIVGGAAFVTAGVLMRYQYPVVSWSSISFFGLAIPLGLMMFIPGCTCLILRKDDFITVYTWRRYSFRWTEVSDIALVRISDNQSVIGFNLSDTPDASSPGWQKRIARRKWVRDTYGKDMLLSPQYNVSPVDLCRIMNQRRDRALASPSDTGVR